MSRRLPRIILASASPRRQELLRLTGLPFEIRPGAADETAPGDGSPVEIARILAERKAEEVAARHPGALVLGADTIVTLDGAILGKPCDAADARRMLALLSGRTHQVITGIALRGAAAASDAVVTDVTFRALTPREIDAYVATGEPMDKAGAYALQGYAALFTTGICGDYANVVGLPLCRLTDLLRACGIPVLGEPA